MTGNDYELASRAVVVNCICVISLTISLTACGDQFKGATDAAAYDLLDPKSAQFRDLRYIDTYVCGQMNGKNRMGAYAGFSNFLAYENGDKWVAERFENGKD